MHSGSRTLMCDDCLSIFAVLTRDRSMYLCSSSMIDQLARYYIAFTEDCREDDHGYCHDDSWE